MNVYVILVTSGLVLLSSVAFVVFLANRFYWPATLLAILGVEWLRIGVVRLTISANDLKTNPPAFYVSLLTSETTFAIIVTVTFVVTLGWLIDMLKRVKLARDFLAARERENVLP